MITKWKYDAFISYSHSKDHSLAKSLQGTIERWGSAVPGRRRLRIFRDETNLAIRPDLWETIKEELNQSRHFILLASPESARSSWVKREVAHFVESTEKATERIGIVLTAGTLPWMKDDKERPEESALTAETLALFQQEPLVVDLRSFREARSSPEYSGRVATLVAAIVGKDKDEVFGEHLTAQRRFITSLITGIVVLGLAIVLALVQYDRAKQEAQRADKKTAEAVREQERADEKTAEAVREKGRADEKTAEAVREKGRADEKTAEAVREKGRADAEAADAKRQAHRADVRARESTSRRLAYQADRLAEARTDTALLLIAQAHRMADNTAIRSSWWRLLGRSDLPRAFLPTKARSARFKPDGSLAVELERGSVTFLERDGFWQPRVRPSSNEQISAAVDLHETWRWSGSCATESSICSCSKEEPSIVGSYDDQDNFCVASQLKIPGWCSDQPFEVPGVEVKIQRHGPIAHVETDLGSGDFACLEATSSSGSSGKRPTLVAGTLRFFAGRPYVDSIVASGPQATSVAQSDDGQRLAVVRSDGGIEVWPGEAAPVTSGRWGMTQLGLSATALSVASSWGGRTVAVATASTSDAEQGGLVLWRNLAVPHLPPTGGAWIRGVWNDQRQSGGALALSDGGDLLVGGVDVNLPVWPTAGLESPPQKHYIGRNAATSADFSREGKFLVATLQPLNRTLSTAAVFAVGSEEEIWRFGKGERGALFLPTDGDAIVTAGDEGVQLWSLSQRKLVRDLLKEAALAIAVDREHGRLAVSLADGDIALWDAVDGRRPIRSGKRMGKGAVLAFISGGDTLLWVSDKGLEAWDWREDTWFRIADTSHRDAAVLPNGSVLGVTQAGEALIYDLDPKQWLDQTCKLVGRNLTRREWSTYIGAAFPYECVCPAYGPGEGWPREACGARSVPKTQVPKM